MATKALTPPAVRKVPSPASEPRPASGQGDPDREILRAALGFKEITVDVPTTATLEEVKATLSIAIEGYKRLSEATERLKPVIGRVLFTIQERKMYRPLYKNFTEFVNKVVVEEMGFGRSNAFDALRIARAFPTMTQDEYQMYGATRLLYAARVTDESEEGYKTLLDESTRKTTEQFKLEVSGIAKEGRAVADSVTLGLRVRVETKERWTKFLEDMGLVPDEGLNMLMDYFLTGEIHAELPEGVTPAKPVATGRKR